MWHPESIFDAGGHLDEGVVHAWLDEQLAPDAATQVERHAAACAPCSAMVAEARGFIAGASRVMASLDEPAVGQAPSRDALLGIVTAAGGAPATAVPHARANVRRWSTRRISVLAAAALVLVTGTLVLRDSGTVREMIQSDQQVLADSAFVAQPEAAPGSALDAAAPAQPAPAAAEVGSGPTGSIAGQIAGGAPDAGPAAQRTAPLVGSAAVPSAANTAGSVGGVGGTAASAGADAGSGFRSPAAKAAPAPAPQPAPPVAAGAMPAVTRARVDRGQDRSSRDVATSRDAAVHDMTSRRVESQAADERRRLQASEAQAPPAAFAEARQSVTRTSAENQAMARMVSSCWRISGSDSVLELLPSESRGAVPGPGEQASAWIPGRVRAGASATTPDRIWWLPLADSASARVRLDDRASADLVITPRRDAALLWRVPRGDSTATWASIPRGGTAESAVSVRCPVP